jgi:hypothetical protein
LWSAAHAADLSSAPLGAHGPVRDKPESGVDERVSE